jgi:hypothetical protein
MVPWYSITLAEVGLERGPLAAEAGRDGPRPPAEDGALMGTASRSSPASEPAYITVPVVSSGTETLVIRST